MNRYYCCKQLHVQCCLTVVKAKLFGKELLLTENVKHRCSKRTTILSLLKIPICYSRSRLSKVNDHWWAQRQGMPKNLSFIITNLICFIDAYPVDNFMFCERRGVPTKCVPCYSMSLSSKAAHIRSARAHWCALTALNRRAHVTIFSTGTKFACFRLRLMQRRGWQN